MAPKQLLKLTVLSGRKSHLLGQITRIKNSLESVDSPINQVELKNKLASLYQTSDPQPPVRGSNGAGPPKEH
ncbi:hypothetical protein TNCV_5004421 [Trichonephila clavipes]|uniref:Uncharacterized protein n=1 Tax=Trichonephila clavipes TaxID=2585209 RepID=A0A8X6UXZ5_TRICX|nr:hypothetical protein TNCV_5004421 [Trichonephila clavipes]